MGTNPYIKEIYKLYYESFESLEPFSHDRTPNDDIEYSENLKDLVDRHADNIPTLARGTTIKHYYYYYYYYLALIES